jgi:hypothetical protein
LEPSNQFQRDYQELCLVIGHLFITFARLEGSLAAMLKLHLANKMGDILDLERLALSSAIYGGMRFSQARDTIKRLATVEKVDQKATALALKTFAHIGHIQSLRDMIAHQQLVPAYEGAGASWQLVDSVTTRDIKNPKVYVFNTEAVGLAAEDLNTAAHRFGGEAKRGHILVALERDLSPIVWRYKPSMLRLVSLRELRADPR